MLGMYFDSARGNYYFNNKGSHEVRIGPWTEYLARVIDEENDVYGEFYVWGEDLIRAVKKDGIVRAMMKDFDINSITNIEEW